MATPAYIKITSETRGVLTLNNFTKESVGSIYQEGHTDQAMVQAYSHTITIPRDPQSGQPTGQRVHAPLCITKIFDKSSPLLHQALTSGEQLSKVEIVWYRTSSDAKQEHYYTTLLEKAIIVEIKSYMHNCQDPTTSQFTHLEEVHFAYRKISWTHETADTVGSDDWGSPLSA